MDRKAGLWPDHPRWRIGALRPMKGAEDEKMLYLLCVDKRMRIVSIPGSLILALLGKCPAPLLYSPQMELQVEHYIVDLR